MNPYALPIIERAKAHVDGWEFHEPGEITFTKRFTRGALWYPPSLSPMSIPCRIEIGCEETPGILWHEIFHGAFHSSPLAEKDGVWGEGMCNAFAACNDGIPRPTLDLSGEVFEKAAAGNVAMQLYSIPEEFIILRFRDKRRPTPDPELFLHFFRRINQLARTKEHGFFSKMMGYDPALGKRIKID